MITESTARCPDCGSPAVITTALRAIDGTIPVGTGIIGMRVKSVNTVVCEHADACPRPAVEDGDIAVWFQNLYSRAAAAEQEAERSAIRYKSLLGEPWTPGRAPNVGDEMILNGKRHWVIG